MNQGILGAGVPAVLGDVGFDCAYTMLPYEASTAGGVGANNRAYIMRAFGLHRQARKLGIHIGTSSGNLCLAVYENNGLAGRAARPLARKATTGSVASPGTGWREFNLDTPVDVVTGDWLYLGTDNTTITFARGSATVLDFLPFTWAVSSAFPAPNPLTGGFTPSTGFYVITV